MSEATRTTSARERATIAARYIRRGRTNGRAFDDCFEMGDGDAVVRALLERVPKDDRIKAFADRCGWTAPGYLDPVTP